MLHFKIKKSALCLKAGQAMAGPAGPLAMALCVYYTGLCVQPLLGLGLFGGAGDVAAGRCTTWAWKEEAIPDRLITFNVSCLSSPKGQDEPKSKWMG